MTLRLGIDVDGVLAEQVSPVLERLRQRHGVRMAREEVRAWDQPVPGTSTNLKVEVEAALEDPDFVLSLQPLPGAPESVQGLQDRGFAIVILTHRSAAVRDATAAWLRRWNIPFDELHNTRESGKEAVRSDLLVDDYPENLLRYSRGGHRILFRQPWNRRFAEQDAGHLGIRVVDAWSEVPQAIAVLFPDAR